MKKILSGLLSVVMLVTACKKEDDPPVITAVTPANNATGVSTSTTLTITFNEDIVAGSGFIVVKDNATNAVAASLNVTGLVSVIGNTATITGLTLQNGTTYYVEIPNTAFKDLGGNAFAGISGNSTWKFTTVVAPAAITPTMSNIAGGYKLDKITVIQPGSTTEVDITNSVLDQCQKDDVISFNSAGTYVITDAGVACVPSSADTGSWSLSGTTTFIFDGQPYTIRRFNGVNFDVSDTDPTFGTIIQYYVKQ